MKSLEDTVSRGFRAPVSSTCNPIWSPCSENKKGFSQYLQMCKENSNLQRRHRQRNASFQPQSKRF